jgi:N-carbamoyl-L-amino-acid hydrolase
MGAMFARRPGQRNDVPPIAMGSHLDTQPTGGKFDGVLGVLGALEALRTLVQAGYETYAPIEVINWTNEEGSRFAPAMVASGVFAGAFTRDWAHAREGSCGRDVRRRARLDRVSRDRDVRPASALRILRTAHRAGPDP